MTGQLVLPGAPPVPAESLSQFDTPEGIAAQMARWAGIGPGMRVLEPSAGLGNLAEQARALGACVNCIEIDPRRVAFLAARGFYVEAGDFLARQPMSFDLVLQNPPFEDGQDLDHILHALAWAPIVVVLAPLGLLDGVERHGRLWSRHTLLGLRVLVRRFKAAGTEMGSQRPFACFKIARGTERRARRRGHDNGVDVGWW